MGVSGSAPVAQLGGTGTVLPPAVPRGGACAVLALQPHALGFTWVHRRAQRLKQTALLTFPETVSATWLPSFKTPLPNAVIGVGWSGWEDVWWVVVSPIIATEAAYSQIHWGSHCLFCSHGADMDWLQSRSRERKHFVILYDLMFCLPQLGWAG